MLNSSTTEIFFSCYQCIYSIESCQHTPHSEENCKIISTFYQSHRLHLHFPYQIKRNKYLHRVKMENRIECLCTSDKYHHEIGCFFKYAIFLLKQFVSSLDILTMDPNDGRNEVLKNSIWIQIAGQYDGYFTGKRLFVARQQNWRGRVITTQKKFVCLI